MKTLRHFAVWSVLLVLSALGVAASHAQTPTVSTFARLGGTPDGFHPFNGLIAGSDGNFYGTTEAGGPANCGTVYQITPGGVLTTLYAFSGSDGANSQAALVDGGDGFFYGTTQNGGTNGTGTLFKISAAGAFTSLHSFDAVNATSNNYNAEGAFPQAGLAVGGDGYFYGAAFAGGTSGNGTIFRVTSAGAFNVVHVFTTYTDGVNPTSALTSGGDGYIYGTAPSGGAGSGVFFKVSPAGDYQVVLSYPTGTGSRVTPASPLLSVGGVFYGLGIGSGSGLFYSITMAGELTVLHTFANTEGTISSGGPTFRSGLSLGVDGNFYASAPTGGASNAGALLRLSPTGDLTSLHAFTAAEGANPTGAPLLAADGNVYGVTPGFLTASYVPGGSVYRVDPAGTLTTVFTFPVGGSYGSGGLIQYSGGNFYGVTKQGGKFGGGTIFGVAGDGSSSATIYDFNPDVTGGFPVSGLHADVPGQVYVATYSGSPDDGGSLLIFNTNAATSNSRVHLLRSPRPESAFGSYFGLSLLFQADLPKSIGIRIHDFYYIATRNSDEQQTLAAGTNTSAYFGIAEAGGDGSGGALFSYSPGGAITAEHSFGVDANDGKLSEGLAVAPDGSLYGTTYGGGTAGVGTIFKHAADGTYTVLYSFQGAGDGAFPTAGPTLGADGNLYGTTSVTSYDAGSFSQIGNGTIFRITPDGTFSTLHVFSSDAYAEGSQPMAALVAASDGKLYGTTSSGGPGGGYGTVFSITPGGTFATVGGFNSFQGGGTSPRAPLIQAADGNLYGVTSSGGTDNGGVVFKVALAGGGSGHPAFFSGEAALGGGAYYLQFANGNPFGYYSYLADPAYIFHFDLGYEYVFDAADGKNGVYLYDFASNTFFYSSPAFPFPYLYDFSLNSVLYYYPDLTNPGHYNTNGFRFFYVFNTGQIITK